MRFFDVLAQVVGLLVLEQRLSYQAIQRQFDLDETYLEDIRREIVDVRQLAKDHEGRMLIWTGGSLLSPVSTALLPSPAAMSSASRDPSPVAERRQLTVMFCDLVGSTDLSGKLDGN